MGTLERYLKKLESEGFLKREKIGIDQVRALLTSAAKNIIRRKGGFFLRTVIETGKKHGMVTMAESVNALLEAGTISEGVAKAVLSNYK